MSAITYDSAALTYDQFPWTYDGTRIYQRTWTESRTGAGMTSIDSAPQTISGGLGEGVAADVEVAR